MKKLIVIGFAALACMLPVKSSLAQSNKWDFTAVKLTADGAPDVTATANATAEAPSGAQIGETTLYFAHSANTTANVTQSQGYQSATGHAYIKHKITFTWTGPGSLVSKNLSYKKVWSVTSTGSNATPYATASFDGTAVTLASGDTGWVSGFALNASPSELVFSTGTNSYSGYSYGYTSRVANATYTWDFTPIK